MIYIAYGSNMDVKQMQHRCPDAQLIGYGSLSDYQLMFRGSKTGSYATILPNKGTIVPIVFWDISKTDEKSLDRYEGYPTFYCKKIVNANMYDNSQIEGMVYLMPENRPRGIPSPEYFEKLWIAYRHFHLNPTYLMEALLI